MSLLQGCVVECVLNLPVFSMFEIATVLFLHVGYWLRGIVLHAAGGASHFTSGESRCCAFFGARAAFPRCHCFRFHLGEASRPHISFFFFFFLWGFVCFAVNPLRCVCGVWTIWSLRRVETLSRPWGTSRLPTRLGRARLSCSLFFRAKSSPHQGKACCLLLKW